MSAWPRRKAQILTFLAGAAVGGLLLWYQASDPRADLSWAVNTLVLPGFILSAPLFVLIGGVHGNHANLWLWSIAPLNGVGYLMIRWLAGWARRIYERYRKGLD